MIVSTAHIHRFFRRLIVAYGVFAVVVVASLICVLTASRAAAVLGAAAFAAVMAVLVIGLARHFGLPLFPPGRGGRGV